jgi:hypothetical protein
MRGMQDGKGGTRLAGQICTRVLPLDSGEYIIHSDPHGN